MEGCIGLVCLWSVTAVGCVWIGIMWLVIRYCSVLCVDWIDVACGQV
jgi:hypothetical protein